MTDYGLNPIVPIRLDSIGIDYRSAPDWPKGLVHDSAEPYTIAGHDLPMYRAYVVEVMARRMKLLDPTHDLAALRVMLADVQALISMGMTAKGKRRAKLTAAQVAIAFSAYRLWSDICRITDRGSWDVDHVKTVIRTLTEHMRSANSPGQSSESAKLDLRKLTDEELELYRRLAERGEGESVKGEMAGGNGTPAP
jgi:hypothetical protein